MGEAYWKTYYDKNREKCKEKMRQYGKAHRQELTDKHRDYYAKNKDRIEEWRKEWRKNRRINKLVSDIEEIEAAIKSLEGQVKETGEGNLMETAKEIEKLKKKLKRKTETLEELRGC